MGTYRWKQHTLLVSAEEVERKVVKLEAGKYYKTRDGRKVGPLIQSSTDFFGFEGFATWYFDGRSTSYRKNEDIISEWSSAESPIREVTRRELVAGVYGRFEVTGTYQNNRVTMNFAP